MQRPIKNPLFWLWLASGAFIIYGTLIPFDLALNDKSLLSVVKNFIVTLREAPVILTSPSVILSEAKDLPLPHLSKMDILSNILLFIPFGFFLTGWLVRQKTNLILSILFSLFCCAALSFAMEILQAFSPSRTSSPFDFLINTTSGFLGSFIGALYFRFFFDSTLSTWNRLLAEKPFLVVTFLYGLILFLGGLIPFDISIQISDLKDALRNTQWIPFLQPENDPLYFTKLATDFLLLIPFTCFCHISLRLYALRLTAFLVPTILLSLTLAGLTEFSQLFIVSRQTDTTHLILAIFAGGLGSGIALGVERYFLWQEGISGHAGSTLSKNLILFLKLLILLGYSSTTAYLLLAPLEFDLSFSGAASRLSWDQIIPLYAYWVRTDIYAVQDLLFTFFLFVPLGAYLYFCLRNFPFSGTLALLLCFFFSSSVELLQFFQPGRYPDLTDVLTASAGALLGIWLTRKFSKT